MASGRSLTSIYKHTLNSKIRPALITEVKNATPDRGELLRINPIAIAEEYEKCGANCISVVTEEFFFKGSFEVMQLIKDRVKIPVLCRDFIIDAHQIALARNFGADAISLVLTVLGEGELTYFLKVCRSLEMLAIVEVRTIVELLKAVSTYGVRVVSISNCNLENFVVDFNTTKHLLYYCLRDIKQRNLCLIVQDGVSKQKEINLLREWGVNALLIGEPLLTASDRMSEIKRLYGSVASDNS